ncbi:uncharacterized protein LOC134747433 [Cydia strobilella]|uniref:uncharacterized protein LOC134747433 n=1 Tax=Cydia strobilella TaxID=1100964 RepID=UPI003007C366
MDKVNDNDQEVEEVKSFNTVLSPTLFSLYVNDMPKIPGVNYALFADDTAFYASSRSPARLTSLLQRAADSLGDWFNRWRIEVNSDKSVAILFTSKNGGLQHTQNNYDKIKLFNKPIQWSENAKYLGVTMDSRLNFHRHIKTVRFGIYYIIFVVDMANKVRPELVTSWIVNNPELVYDEASGIIFCTKCETSFKATKKGNVDRHINGAIHQGRRQNTEKEFYFDLKLCGAYRTVSLNSALVLTGILPLDLRIREAAELYRARKGLTRALPDDREVEVASRYTESPHPALCQELSFTSLPDREALERYAVQQVNMYTDGSKIEGKVGASLSTWKGEREDRAIKITLANYCTVYQAELLAIHRATEEIKRRGEASFGIFSDSRAALETLTNRGSLHRLALEARRNLQAAFDQGKDVSLFWVKAHAGLAGNERADELAKEAALSSGRRADYDRCPVSFAKRFIREETLAEWAGRYASGSTASVTKVFFPDAVAAYRLVRKIQPTGAVTQLMTGHGGFSSYLHRFKCKDNPSCICEPSKEETVEHLITECPVHDYARIKCEAEMGVPIKWENVRASRNTCERPAAATHTAGDAVRPPRLHPAVPS